ncbi:MAG: carbonic anhydrase family protein [archaeon]|nr:carbonic anhydrase family protein [archaeon]
MKIHYFLIVLLIPLVLNINLHKKAAKTFLNLMSGKFKEDAKPAEEKKEDKKEAKAGEAPSNQTKSTQDGKTTLDKKQNVNETIEGWFSVKSNAFKDPSNFPALKLPSGRPVYFRFNRKSNFLINGFFDPYKKKDENFPKDDNLFYFKTNQNLLYFVATKNSTAILAAVRVKKCENVKTSDMGYCIKTEAFNDEDSYTFCSQTKEQIETMMCSLKFYNNETLPLSCSGGAESLPEQTTKVSETVTQNIFIIPKSARNCNDGWNYDSKGSNWECICKEGFEQSPIELPKKEEAIHSDVAPVFYFNPVPKVKSIRFEDNALKIDASGLGSITTMNGEKYQSKDIVFHTPAEHQIKGMEKQADMEMEIIYEGVTEGDINKQVVLSFLFESVAGKNVRFFSQIDILNLPSPLLPDPVGLIGKIKIPYIQYLDEDVDTSKAELASDFPLKPFSFYTYQGSLSAPPCTERTIRYVASEFIPLSTVVVEFFKDALKLPGSQGGSAMFNVGPTTSVSGGCKANVETTDGDDIIVNEAPSNKTETNARELQNINERKVFYWDMVSHCGYPRQEEPPIKGHYESVHKKFMNYYYVNSDKPTGLPNSFVIDENEARGKTVE